MNQGLEVKTMTEYKVVQLAQKFSMSKMGQSLEDILNEHAKLGWKLKLVEGLFVIFEK